MKGHIRIPTVEYGYVEFEVDDSAENIKAFNDDMLRLFKGGFGLDQKEFNQSLDRYLTDGTGETEQYMRMSKEQMAIFQEIKKSLKRIESKNGNSN